MHITYLIVASSSKLAVALGGGVAAVVLLAGVGVLVVIFLRRRGVFTHKSVRRGDNHPNISLDPLRCEEETFNKR